MSAYTRLESKDAVNDHDSRSSFEEDSAGTRCIEIPERAWSAIFRAIALGAGIIVVASLTGLVASTVFLSRIDRSSQPAPQPEAFFPVFGKIFTTFEDGGEFTRNDSYGDKLWNELVPMGAGYVRVPNPRQYALPQSESVQTDGPYTEMFQASVVHQLHCMGVLRNYTRAYENGLPPPDGGHLHVRHCIEYVRQAILCTADTTLEQADARGAFTAQGAVHQCRDWRSVKAFLEQNRVDDALPGILDT